jgi:hypothetical protein
MSRRFGAFLGAAALLVALPGTAAADDFGDAPEGSAGVYLTAPGVVARFPSKAASGGPRHRPSGLRLGPSITQDGDARLVNRDRDDGASIERLRRCGSSEVSVLIDARRLPASQRTGDAVLNAWFDWNRDGDWADTGCAAEWAIPNMHIPLSVLGRDGVGLVPIEIRGGDQVQDLVARFTLTLAQDVTGRRDGGAEAPYTAGETEDLVFGPSNGVLSADRPSARRRARRTRGRAAGGGGYVVTCKRDPIALRHGRDRPSVEFRILDSNPDLGPIHAEPTTQGEGTWTARANPRSNQRGAPPGQFLSTSFRFRSTNQHRVGPDDDPVERVTVTFNLERGSVRGRAVCHFIITHDQAVRRRRPPPPPAAAPPPGPGIAPPPPGGGAPPPPPPPPAARCDVQFVSSTDSGYSPKHVKLTMKCNRKVKSARVTGQKNFDACDQRPTGPKSTGCSGSGQNLTGTWNPEPNDELILYGRVTDANESGTYTVEIKDDTDAVIFTQQMTIP